MKKKFLLTAAAVVVLLAAVVAAGSFYLVNFALVDAPRHRDSSFSRAIANYPELRSWIDSLQAEGALRDTFVVMPTGERAHAIFARSSKAHGATAVLVHGYTDNATSMLMIARIYNHFLNYNILLPDLHAHGQSYGNDIQMGWKDRLDVMHWIGLAPGMFRTPADSMRLVVHGISMGAATTICVSGEQTPNYVKCFVEDCGYTSVWDEFAHELKGRFSLPEFPLLYTASWVVRMKYGGRSVRLRHSSRWLSAANRCSSSTVTTTLTCLRLWSIRSTRPSLNPNSCGLRPAASMPSPIATTKRST